MVTEEQLVLHEKLREMGAHTPRVYMDFSEEYGNFKRLEEPPTRTIFVEGQKRIITLNRIFKFTEGYKFHNVDSGVLVPIKSLEEIGDTLIYPMDEKASTITDYMESSFQIF
ncbi:MAG: hypothetical protein KAQ83_00865, partial [Nanoarchaeota archaeon]|nr:hypothetical protein [Nanoarchaeota archaeon]